MRDLVVGSKDLERDADEAKRKASQVNLLKATGTRHVQYMAHDKERYWEGVEQLWKDAAA